MSFDIEPGRSDPGRTETRYAPEAAEAPVAAPVLASAPPPDYAPSRRSPSPILVIVAVIAIGLLALAVLRLILG